MTRRGVLFFAGVAVAGGLLAGISLWPVSEPAEEVQYERLTLDAFEQRVRGLILSRGSGGAYQDFARSIAALTSDLQHTLMHQFAAVLYRMEGLAGFSACDFRFQYGCYHELMGRAIADHGFGIVPEVYDACISVPRPLPFACLHGIGHGLVASTAYTKEGLHDALALCDTLSRPAGLAPRCYQGVFMEYNQQSMLGAEVFRPLGSDKNYQEPCASLDAKYQEACYFELPAWWYRLAPQGDSEEVFGLLGERCLEAKHEESNVQACFEGVGNIVTPAVQFDADKSRRLCEAASSVPLYQLFCKSSAALSLAVTADTYTAAPLCEELKDEALEYCHAYAANTVDLSDPPPPPAL